MHSFFDIIPKQLSDFLVVAVFSLIIGVMQKRIHHSKDDNMLIGTDRTFTFIGILGYLLLISDLANKYLFIFGGLALVVFLGIFYINRIKIQNDFGLTTIFIALLTYCLPLLVLTQPFWLSMLVFVVVILLTEMKDTFSGVSKEFDKEEVFTLGKFLVIAGVILPIVPDQPIVDFLKITPYKIWLSMVVISSISYISYLLQKFIFKKVNFIFTGILGGLYSSTATTIVLARKIKIFPEHTRKIVGSIILATMMMYLRIAVLVIIFNPVLARCMVSWLLFMAVVSAVAGVVFIFFDKSKESEETYTESFSRNHPLELKIASIFTILFVFVSFVIYYVMQEFGSYGLSVLSYMVGVFDIDPFLLNLFQGHYDISTSMVVRFSFHAIISNNIMKMFFAAGFGGRSAWKWLVIGFSFVIGINLLLLLFI